MRGALGLALALALSACTLALPGAGGGADGASPLADQAIAVTPLDTPADPVPAAGPDPAADAPPPSPAQLACERTGGHYVRAGASAAMTCVRPTRDAGRACTRQTQCEGYCLARSATCAPLAPLFGCHEVLQADGRRVTLCLD